MKAFLLGLLLLSGPTLTWATEIVGYDVTYLKRSSAPSGPFVGVGSYEFLWGPTYTTVYLEEPDQIIYGVNGPYLGNAFVFIGIYQPAGAPAELVAQYGWADIPAVMPLISFPTPALFDDALATPIVQGHEHDGPIATPEPSSIVLLALGGLWVGVSRWNRSVKRP